MKNSHFELQTKLRPTTLGSLQGLTRQCWFRNLMFRGYPAAFGVDQFSHPHVATYQEGM